MINVVAKTEYSFRYAYGKITNIVTIAKNAVGISDRYFTFGHIPFHKECKKQGKKPLLGVELAFVDDATLKVRQNPVYINLIAVNPSGLFQIYELVSKSTKQKYYYNRVSKKDLQHLTDDVIIIYRDISIQNHLSERGVNTYFGITPTTPFSDTYKAKHPWLPLSDNLYDKAESEPLYQIIMGNGQWEDSVHPRHLLDEWEWRYELEWMGKPDQDICFKNLQKMVDSVTEFDLPRANLPKATESRSLREMCHIGAIERGCDLSDPVYEARLDRELELIHEKKYDEYFYLVWDLVKYAKDQMLVGPARGSSAGSLVCYLLYITDIDPIPHGLIFERFIDINRLDLPDIDIDFQDTKREKLIDYLKEKYGRECVAKLGTVSKYKPKVLLGEIAKCVGVPSWEVTDLKNAIPERSGGDARANNCIEDTFKDLEIGQKFIEKHPEFIYAKEIENHTRHFGQHAAGIVVADAPLYNYCSVDSITEGGMLDKKDAETVNLLKMDCLGLRTLSVLQDCLDLIKKDRDWLINYPLNDQRAFDVINERRFSGIFQFEGYALINTAKQIYIDEFDSVAAITALARPGPLVSGGTNKYIVHKNNPGKIEYLPKCEEYTKDTYGVVVYQEQVMNIARNVGALSWEDTSELRKAMSKSLGDEFFGKYKDKFVKGAAEKHNLSADEAEGIWNNINAMGSWAFNKSHAVSYGLISYWCMALKAHYPLEFSLATLKNAKSDEQVIGILKELDKEGFKFEAFSQEKSMVDWSIQDGKLVGGYINVKGVGIKKAQTLIKKRREGTELTVAEKRLVFNAETPYDHIFEFKEHFSKFYEHWDLFFKNQPVYLEDIEDGTECRFLAKSISTSLRDANEEILIKKRDGEVIKDGKTAFLDIKFADDTDTVPGRIDRWKFEQFGRAISEQHKVGSYYLVNGKCCNGFKFIMIKNIKRVTKEEIQNKIKKYENSKNE